MKTKGILLIACLTLLLRDTSCAKFKLPAKIDCSGDCRGGIDRDNQPVKSPVDEYIDDYKLLKQTIGKGKYAHLEMAKHEGTNEIVAIRIINEAILTPIEKLQVEKEARIMKKLKHRNIWKLLKDIEDDEENKRYLVMEVVSGDDLIDYLLKKGKIDEKDARRIFRQMIEAAEYCHYKKVAHRNLKPDKFLLDSEGNIKLADFSIATEFKLNEKLKTFPGTIEYMAPEVQQNITYDGPKADVWSLGVNLYTMVTGNFPFHDTGKYFVPNVTRECAVLIDALLEKNPKKRPTLQDIMLKGPNEWLNKDCEKLKPYTEPALKSALKPGLV